jgi:predicted RecA/RadA family phage recombinase
MADYVNHGKVIEFTPSSALSAGQPVLVGSSLLTIATQPIAANAAGSVATEGVWSIAKGTGNSTAISAGTVLYWDNANSVVTSNSTGTVRCGIAVGAAANAVATVALKLNG